MTVTTVVTIAFVLLSTGGALIEVFSVFDEGGSDDGGSDDEDSEGGGAEVVGGRELDGAIDVACCEDWTTVGDL